jgi:hypothetical protein
MYVIMPSNTPSRQKLFLRSGTQFSDGDGDATHACVGGRPRCARAEVCERSDV